MFTLTNKIKFFSLMLVILGLMGILYGFYSAPSSIDEAKEMVADHHNNEEYNVQQDKTNEYYNKYGSTEDGGHMSHDEHVYHQLANRPWAALYVAAFFFFMISLGTLAFYAIQRAAQSGWSPVLFRVMEGITAYLLPGGLALLLILLLSTLHLNHLFIWMDPEAVSYTHLTLPTICSV